MVGVGVVGYGYWGPNLVRNFSRNGRACVVRVADRDKARLAAVCSAYPSIAVTEDATAVTQARDVDAVVIATPPATHFDLAMQALEAGKHVLVEKPMAVSTSDCAKLIAAAERAGRALLVDHTFVYTPAVRWIRDAVQSGALGEIYYADSVRINLGLIQKDINVLWDLAPHDLSIFEYCFGKRVLSVAATGMRHANSPTESIAYLSLRYEDGMMGHVHVNWLSPVKVRQMIVAGSKKMLVYNDLEPSEKIRVYDRGAEVSNGAQESAHRLQISYRTGDMWAPAIPVREALDIEAEHFLDCIEKGAVPEAGGKAGLNVVNVLEAAEESLMQGGARVTL